MHALSQFSFNSIIKMDTSLDFSKKECCPVSHIRKHHEESVAFVVHRNKNKNVVVYSGNMIEGVLHTESPLNVNWIMFEQDGHPSEGLNMIERNTAYGMTTKPMEGKEGHYHVTLTALKDRILDLHVHSDGTVVGKANINGQEDCIVERVFVQSKSSWGLPKVEYIEIHGKDTNGNSIMETKKP